jgi:hypothetical protein
MELQQLNKEYTEQSHAIGRKKCNLDSVREARLIGIDDAMHSERRNLLEQIAELRRQQAGLPKDDQKRLDLSNEIRTLENQVTILKADAELARRRVVHQAAEERRDLDEQSRQLTERYEQDKIAIYQRYAAEED